MLCVTGVYLSDTTKSFCHFALECESSEHLLFLLEGRGNPFRGREALLNTWKVEGIGGGGEGACFCCLSQILQLLG